MCGIAGLVDKRRARAVDEKDQILRGMLAAIAHRGPDGKGVVVGAWGGMAHARLSILDLSAEGRQPMSNESGSLTLSFNGEIYNHQTLRDGLPHPSAFRSHTDTESLLYAYEAWGEHVLEKLKGMFAFSIYDNRDESIFLAVDRFGIKPLYYVDTPDFFAWSSEVKAFAALPGFSFALDTAGLGEYLMFRSTAGAGTLFAGVKKMLPGECMRYAHGGLSSPRAYWAASCARGRDANASVSQLLARSVSEHMLADVPVGVQLSGGVDSSLISALVRPHVPDHLHSFSVGLADAAWNEFSYSSDMASRLHTTHHQLIFSERDFVRALPEATYYLDEPVHHSHAVPMMMLAAEAARHVKVLMSGEGADELFGGYRRYEPLMKRGSASVREIVVSNAYTTEDLAISLLQRGRPDLSYREALLCADGGSLHARLARYDLATYLPSLLLRQDKMGMRSGLENRVPFLDHELAAAALALADDDCFADGHAKISLKRIAEAFVPAHIVYRKKVGFAQPVSAWLRNPAGLGGYLPLLEDSILADHLQNDVIRTLVDAHRRADEDHGAILWTLLTLELWARVFIGGQSPESISAAITS